MESEKVKEIKKALECCKQNEIENTCEYCGNCPASNWDYETECNERLKEKLKARHEVNRLLLMPVRDVVLSTIEGLFEDVDKTLKELINE